MLKEAISLSTIAEYMQDGMESAFYPDIAAILSSINTWGKYSGVM